MGKTCQICGRNSEFYPLCKEHLGMKAKGLVIKNEITGKWELKNNNRNNNYNSKQTNNLVDIEDSEDDFEDDEYVNDSEICYVCGEYAPNGKQCKNCYYETLDYMDSMDKNRKAYEIRDYYYNLKQNIYRIKSIENKESNCNKLIALAILCRNIHGDDSLISRVYKDIKDIFSKVNKENNEEEIVKIKSYDDQKNETSGQVRCTDGHWVENDLERQIDDILYSLRLPHVYAKRVNQITERTVKCDWFIPVLSDTKGIYIELWGMDTQDYKQNKEEKIKLYEEEELPLIQIYKKDVLSDISILKDNIESKINELEKQIKKKK